MHINSLVSRDSLSAFLLLRKEGREGGREGGEKKGQVLNKGVCIHSFFVLLRIG